MNFELVKTCVYLSVHASFTSTIDVQISYFSAVGLSKFYYFQLSNRLRSPAFYLPAAALATLVRKTFDPELLTERLTIISMGRTALP